LAVRAAIKATTKAAGLPPPGLSRTRQATRAAAGAVCVEKRRGAGAMVRGKLSPHEFAIGGPSFDLPWPPARNPWNTGHYAGGSSSGSAVAVAAGLAMGALGTDTGGSVRSPCFLCSAGGVKPTFRLLRRTGRGPVSGRCDHGGT